MLAAPRPFGVTQGIAGSGPVPACIRKDETLVSTLPQTNFAERIPHLRLDHQQIAQTHFDAPAAVVRHLGAVQAQDYLGALWSIGLRLPGTTEADVERAVAEGTIVRTWPMRGTLHFVAPEDVRWMLALLTPRILAGSARRHAQLGLDDATFARSVDLLAGAMTGQPPQTRSELMDVLEQKGIDTAGQRGYHILWWAAHHGLICCGPRRGKQHTFAWLDDWVPATRSWARDEALAELAARYFTGHGPATLHDFRWWSGLTAADARTGLAAAEARLAAVEVDGQRYWMPADTGDPSAASRATYLLPGFDEFMLGYTDRSAALAPEFIDRIHPGKNGIFKPTVVIDGQVTGIWKRTLKKRTVTLEFTPFTPWRAADRESFHRAARRYGEFVQREADVAFLDAG